MKEGGYALLHGQWIERQLCKPACALAVLAGAKCPWLQALVPNPEALTTGAPRGISRAEALLSVS